MTTTATCHYRGYEILPWHLWSSWCVGVYRTRADLPLMSQSPLLALAPRKEDALGHARQSIDRILSDASNIGVPFSAPDLPPVDGFRQITSANEPCRGLIAHHLTMVNLALATMAASSSSVMSMARLKAWVSEVLNVGALP